MLRDPERGGDLRASQILPVGELERHLEVERQRLQGAGDQRGGVLSCERGADSGAQVGDGLRADGIRGAPMRGAELVEEPIASDGEEIGAKRGMSNLISAFEAVEKGPLNQVVDIVAELAAEEPTQRIEVSFDERARSVIISAAPGFEQLGVGPRHPQWYTSRVSEPSGEEADWVAGARPSNDDAVGRVLRAKVMRGLLGGASPVPRIGRFTVLERVGAGASGSVFAAYDDVLDRRVALKVLQRARDGESLLPEARVLAKLRHPNIVTVHEAGVSEGQVFVAMEFVEGGTLRDWLASAPPLDDVLGMLRGAARGLAAAHDSGVAHGDFKPDNVLVAEDGPRVADFGLAQLVDAEPKGPGGGSPAYMAPERIDGGPPTAAADQFAWAVTAVEALGGSRPFTGESLPMLRLAMLEPPTLPEMVTGDAPLAAVIRRALDPEPAQRFSSMSILLDALTPPSKRRAGRWVFAGVAASLVAGAWVVGSRSGDPCGGGDALLAPAYDAEVAQQLRGVMRQHLGPEVGVPVLERLDAYGAAWVDAHRETCTASRVQGVQSDSMYDRRMQCLLDLRLELQATTDALLSIENADEAGRAAAVVDALVPVDACTASAIESGPSGPKAEDADAVHALREQLAAAWSDFRLARYDRSLERARAADAAAAGLDYRPTKAEAAFLLGTAEGRVAGLDAAEATLRRARLLAAEADMRGLAASVSTQLLRTVMFSGDADRVADLAAFARADIVEATRSTAEIDGIVGESLLQAGDPQAARASIDLALSGESRPAKRALLLVNRGSAALAMGESAEALADYRAAYALAEAHYGVGHPRVGFFVHRVGRGELGVGRAREASNTLERALRLREAVLGVDDRAVASVLVDLADARLALGEAEAARGLLQRALEIRTRALGVDHPRTVQLRERIASD